VGKDSLGKHSEPAHCRDASRQLKTPPEPRCENLLIELLAARPLVMHRESWDGLAQFKRRPIHCIRSPVQENQLVHFDPCREKNMRYLPGFMLIGLLATFPALGQSQGAAEQELVKLENAWNSAYIKGDGAFLKQLYADEYDFTDSEGALYDKTTEISELVSGKTKITSANITDVKVHIYGDTAVVTGLNTLKGSYGGEDMSGPYRFTDVFVKRGGRWQVVASHSSLVVKK
jgi:ketosteroid isomerase-like protein